MRIPGIIHVTLALSLLASAAPVMDTDAGGNGLRDVHMPRAKSGGVAEGKGGAVTIAKLGTPNHAPGTTKPKHATTKHAPTTAATTKHASAEPGITKYPLNKPKSTTPAKKDTKTLKPPKHDTLTKTAATLTKKKSSIKPGPTSKAEVCESNIA
jgi:hypothetical protein